MVWMGLSAMIVFVGAAWNAESAASDSVIVTFTAQLIDNISFAVDLTADI